LEVIAASNIGGHLDLAMPDTWYVTFEVQQRGVLPKPRYPRQTMTFATEDEARRFARVRHEQGLTVFAGTINPHSPRQLISAEEIIRWLTVE
jgi:hypothetical protein